MNILSDDLDYILNQTQQLWIKMHNQRIFITGGTGFFGCWILESLIWANKKLNLNLTAVILTRNIHQFSVTYPHLFQEVALQFYEGDIRNFEFPEGEFSFVIHAATDSVSRLNETDPILMWDTIVQGTKHVLEFAVHCNAKHFLLVSSGAVYGKQAANVPYLTEQHIPQLSNDEVKSVYAVGKRTAEYLCQLYAEQCALNIKIARCFAFIGPYFPLDAHFALGNFIRDGIRGGPIIVNGDGTPYRSYLYAADLMIWLWTILFSGKRSRIYNVGSDEPYSIAQTAHMVAKNFRSKPTVKIMNLPQPSATPERYLPDVSRARVELNVRQHISLDVAIQKTVDWHSLRRNSFK